MEDSSNLPVEVSSGRQFVMMYCPKGQPLHQASNVESQRLKDLDVYLKQLMSLIVERKAKLNVTKIYRPDRRLASQNFLKRI